MDNLGMDFSLEDECYWQILPDNILFHVFSFLPASTLLKASCVCRSWSRVAFDELLWKDLFYRHWKINRKIGMAPGRKSWFKEYKRLYYRVPCVESEVINKHADQVLHVSFSHNGNMFSTCSKDGYVKVWNATYPVSLRNKQNMKEFSWKYTQYSQFNDNDTLLLVSGVHFGPNSTSGEIAVFSVTGDFEMQARVINKPYDVFGTWYNNDYLLSGNLHWLGELQSCSALWMNKATQANESEHESVVMRLYRFLNVNASSIRTVMIAKCLKDSENNNMCDCQSRCCSSSSYSKTDHCCEYQHRIRPVSNATVTQGVLDGTSESHASNNDTVCQKIQHLTMFENGCFKTQMIAVDSDWETGKLNGTFEYNSDYRDAEADVSPTQGIDTKISHKEENSQTGFNLVDGRCVPALQRDGSVDQACGSEGVKNPKQFSEMNKVSTLERLVNEGMNRTDHDHSQLNTIASDIPMRSVELSHESISGEEGERSCECCDHCHSGLYLDGSIEGYPLQSNLFLGADHNHAILDHNPSLSTHTNNEHFSLCSNSHQPYSGQGLSVTDVFPDKFLIFTMGEKTYTPHQIGIKRIKAVEKITKHGVQVLPDVENNLHGMDRADFDALDHTIDLHGHIIGMCLSPDQRYLYVNSRPWPRNYRIENVMHPPPIAQEIDIHVIDLVKMTEVGQMYQAHKAYTPNDECFFIFLDVCNEYVASGAEDKHGYIWDRHYGICLGKFPHTDVVNCVAFNRSNSEVLVTVSDDHSIRVWRSRHLQKQLEKKTGIPPGWCINS